MLRNLTPIYRVKRSTIVVCVLAAIPLLIVNLKGDRSPDINWWLEESQIEFRHGWPWPYLWRWLPAELPAPSPWSFQEGETSLFVFDIAKNIATAFLILAILGIAWEYCTRVTRWRQFGLRTTFLATLVFCGILAWWRSEVLAERREVAFTDQPRSFFNSQFSVRPAWLRIMLPEPVLQRAESLLPYRLDSIEFVGESQAAFSTDDTLGHTRLGSLMTLNKGGAWVDSALELLVNASSLERFATDISLRDSDLARLKSKATLLGLEIHGHNRLTDTGINILESFPRLRYLRLGPCNASWSSIKELQRKRPDLQIELDWDDHRWDQ
jgi:hypothetical protein